MTIYHVLPMIDPRKKEEFITAIQADTNINKKKSDDIRGAALDFKNVVIENVTHKNISSESNIYYLFDKNTDNPQSFNSLINNLTDGDELIIHGEGQPFVLGLPTASIFDTHGRSLAKLFKLSNCPDIDINIKLLSCNSAVNYTIASKHIDKSVTVHFARDMANALYHEFQYNNLKVTGYTGFIVEKGKGKYTVSHAVGAMGRAKLEDAADVYRGGECISPPKKQVITDLSHIAFSGDNYTEPKEKAFRGHLKTERAILQNRSSTTESRVQFAGSSNSFFHHSQANTDNNTIDDQLNSHDNASLQEEKKDEKDTRDPMLPPMP